MDLEEFEKLVDKSGAPQAPIAAQPAQDAALTDATLDALVGQPATIEGDALDAMLGAIVRTDDGTPVYVEGLEEWDDALHGKRVKVTGTLRKTSLAPDPTVGADGAVSHGKVGDDYVLEGARWQTI